MLLSEMVQEVKNIIQDSSLDASVEGYINEAFLQASGRVNIPDLKRVGAATTIPDQMYVSLAGIQDGFSGRLSKLINSDTIVRFSNIEDLTEWILSQNRELDEVGAVESVALEGRTLWYFPSPATEEDILCILYTNPPVMEYDGDSPDAFPEICHRNIGIHGAAFLAYCIIEDGVEDSLKVNTNFHYGMFEKGIIQLVEWIGRHRVHQITSVANDACLTDTQAWNSNFTRWKYAR